MSSVAPIVQDWISPDRNTLMVLRQNWPLMRRSVVVIMLACVFFSPGDPLVSLLSIGVAVFLYLLWQIGFDALFLSKRFNTPGHQQALSVVQFLASTIIVTLIVWWADLTPTDDAWLLYFIPLMTIGQSLRRRWALSFIGLSAVLALLSALVAPLHDLPSSLTDPTAAVIWSAALRDGFLRGLASAYVGLSAYIVIRSLAYQNCIVSTATEAIDQVTKQVNWDEAANAIAKTISALLGGSGCDVAANVIVHNKQKDTLAIVGSSTDGGQQLVANNFTYHGGITGWTAHNGVPCFLNDVACDPEKRFLHHNAFSTTCSALAAAFNIDGRQAVVLEVESPQPRYFANEDLQLLQIVGSHLLALHERASMLSFHRTLADLGQELTQSILQDMPIEDMLQHIGQVYRKLIHADILTFYYHSINERELNRVTIRRSAPPERAMLNNREPENLIEQLMKQQRMRFFADAQTDQDLVRERPHHKEQGIKPFVLREGVISCAAIPLVLGKESVGLMWVNFQHFEPFDPATKYLIQLLAPYATLAIFAERQTLQEEEERKESLRRMVHDSLSHRLDYVSHSLGRLSRCTPASPRWKEELRNTANEVAAAKQAVKALINNRTAYSLQSFLDYLESQKQMIETLYSVKVRFYHCKLPETAISVNSGSELMYACEEAIGNSVSHSQASRMWIAVSHKNNQLTVSIRDNGIGFDPGVAKQGLGLNDIQQRIRNLSGTTTIKSAPGRGARVRFCIPLPSVA